MVPNYSTTHYRHPISEEITLERTVYILIFMLMVTEFTMEQKR